MLAMRNAFLLSANKLDGPKCTSPLYHLELDISNAYANRHPAAWFQFQWL